MSSVTLWRKITYLSINEALFLSQRNSVTKCSVRSFRSDTCRHLSEVATSSSQNLDVSKKANVSKAMKAYLQRISEHDKLLKDEINKYEISKRHLANMMGENPETFTQDDINNAVAYLLPSGLHEPKARPAMIHPLQLFAKKKEAEFDGTGRPHNTFFYTGKPVFYGLLHDISVKVRKLDDLLLRLQGELPEQDISFEDSVWISKEELEETLLERLTDKLFEHFILSMERFMEHPMAHTELDFIMKYRKKIATDLNVVNIPQLMHTENGVPYMTGEGRRKKANASVKVFGHGSGKFSVNGEDILYFKLRQDRQQVMFPLQFSGLLRAVDVEATVEGSGPSGQSGAIRYAIAVALRSFVSEDMVEKMRVAGLLTHNLRKKERQKPGRRRARRGFTWRKR